MKLLSKEVIDKGIEILNEMPESDVQELMEDLTQSQSLLIAYLMAVTEMYEEDVQEELFFIGFSVIHIMMSDTNDKKGITASDIDSTEAKNLMLLEVLEGVDEYGTRNILEEMLETYNQKYLFKYAIDELFCEEENGGLFFELEEIGVMMVYLKTIIDCLDK